LEGKTNIPTAGIIPMLNLPLPDEDAYSHNTQVKHSDKPEIAVIRTPYMSNFDEFDALVNEPSIQLNFVDQVSDLDNVVAVILAGSKHVSHDLDFLKQKGFAAKLHQLAKQGVQLLGICGGMQMLGKTLQDPHNLEGGHASQGLNLLNIDQVLGYEIHHGHTVAADNVKPYLLNQQQEVIGYIQGNIAGMYAHGLFDNAVYRQQFLQKLGIQSETGEWSEQVDAALDTLALHLELNRLVFTATQNHIRSTHSVL